FLITEAKMPQKLIPNHRTINSKQLLSMVLLAKAVQTLPIGTAYPVWTGIGAVGTVVLGIVFFHEPVSFLRLFFISTLIASIIGLKLVSH
ncbi:DMT family transporter, partial [Phocaeicola intestinalis]|uniref:DMT family transporter n=1 Tax=Phocaeicola intestinalis TaxID=2762212 RepID=UPI001CD8BD65